MDTSYIDGKRVRMQEEIIDKPAKAGDNCNECHSTVVVKQVDDSDNPTGKLICPNCGVVS